MATREAEVKGGHARLRRVLKWGSAAVLLYLLLFPFYQMASIYAYGFTRDTSPADAAIVMGAAEYNNRPSPVFKERIEHAISLYEQGRVHALVFTGGPGKGSKFAEAQVGRDYAVKRGVPADKVFLEAVSKVTYENLREARKIVGREKFKRVLVVSDPLHMKRAVVMARDLGMDAYPSPTPTSQFKTWRTKGPLLMHETYYYCLYAVGRYFLD